MNDSNNNILDDLLRENGLVDTNQYDGGQGFHIAPSGNVTNEPNFDTGWGTWWQKSDEAGTYRDDIKESTKPSENQQLAPSGSTAVKTQNKEATSSGHQAAAAVGYNPAQPTTREQFPGDRSLPDVRASLDDINQDNENLDSFIARLLKNATEEVPTDPIAINNSLYNQFPADVTPTTRGADSLVVNPAMISNLNATVMPLMDFNGAAGNLGIEPLTSGQPNDAGDLVTGLPATNRIDRAPAQNQNPRGIQTRKKKPSRSQQKAHFDSMGVAVGYEFKRDGEIRYINGQLEWLDPLDTWSK
ncbi:MAG: hypothetical protein Q9214_005699 [Letrouitia sp. 1 TL-2023]